MATFIWPCNYIRIYDLQFIHNIMVALAIEIAVMLFFAYIVVCIVEMVTKKLVAYICVAISLLIYGLLILAFQPGEDQRDLQHHNHYRCK